MQISKIKDLILMCRYFYIFLLLPFSLYTFLYNSHIRMLHASAEWIFFHGCNLHMRTIYTFTNNTHTGIYPLRNMTHGIIITLVQRIPLFLKATEYILRLNIHVVIYIDWNISRYESRKTITLEQRIPLFC